MADNYLEKRMEDYRRGVIKPTSRRYHAALPSGKQIAAAPHNMLLCFNDMELCTALLNEFQGVAGLKAAFVADDMKYGGKLAQSTGALYVPVRSLGAEDTAKAVETVSARWGKVDLMITDTPGCVANTEIGKYIFMHAGSDDDPSRFEGKKDVREVILPGDNADFRAAASAVLLMLTPQAAMIGTISLKL